MKPVMLTDSRISNATDSSTATADGGFQVGDEVQVLCDLTVDGENIRKGAIGEVEEILDDGDVQVALARFAFSVCLEPSVLKTRKRAKVLGYSLKDRRRHLRFWSKLSDVEKKYFARATEEMPLDLMAGLMAPGKNFCKRKPVMVWFLIIFLRMILNMGITLELFHKAWGSGETVVFGKSWTHSQGSSNTTFWDRMSVSQSQTELREEAVVMCETNLQADMPQKDKDKLVDINCIHADLSRLRAFKFISLFEFLSVSVMFLGVTICWLLHICGVECVAARFPGMFIFVPKIVSKFSSISFLQLINFSRIRSTFAQGEWKLIWTMATHPIGMKSWGIVLDGDDTLDTPADNKDGTLWAKMCQAIASLTALCVAILAVGLSFQALLVKLTAIHFASVRSFYTWSVYEWLVIGGFLNQIAGICFVEELELHRLLLFKFGGSNSTWSFKQCRVCAAYISLLAKKINDGYLKDKRAAGAFGFCQSRLGGIAVLSTIDSGSLQMLLLSGGREGHVFKTRDERFLLFKRLFDPQQQQDLVQTSSDTTASLLQASDSDEDHEEAMCRMDKMDDEDFVRTRLAALRQERNDVLDGQRDRELPSERLLVAAQLQAHIEDLQERAERKLATPRVAL